MKKIKELKRSFNIKSTDISNSLIYTIFLQIALASLSILDLPGITSRKYFDYLILIKVFKYKQV